MGQVWVPKSAVSHKLSNFQPFGFKFGLNSLLLGISTWKIKNSIWDRFGHFWGTDPFWGTKSTRSHNYGNCHLIDLQFGRLVQLNDV